MEVVVVGGGVTGLTTALQLVREPKIQCKVSVLAKSFDFTCSHAAGAWWIPDPTTAKSFFGQGANAHGSYTRWAEQTWKEMSRSGAESGCQLLEGIRLYSPEALGSTPLEALESPVGLASMVPKFRRLDMKDRGQWPGAPVELPESFRGAGQRPMGGASFETFFVRMETYLAYLRRELNASGCVLVERDVKSLEEVTASYPSAIIVNCAGLGAGALADDASTFAVRGQTVLVRAPEQTSFFSLQTGDDSPVYVLPQGDGTVVLGGCTIRETPSTALGSRRVPGGDGWRTEGLDDDLAQEIRRDAEAFCPALRGAEVLRCSVGWRPFRAKGARVERDPKRPKVVHNYGHGDVGVILSWGCAKDVAELLMERSKL